jgi:hypothetical protein
VAARTVFERALFVGAVAALAIAAMLAARDPALRTESLLPETSNGIVVLDLSASISADTHQRIRATLLRLASGGGRYGVVVFSDDAYEALPPGTDASELRRIARYFDTGQGQLSDPNPWSVAFSAGTRISAGLELARSVVERDRLGKPAVLLVSDLDDDPADVPRLRRELERLQQSGLLVRVVGLNPAPEDERFFARLLAEPDALRRATLDAPSASSARARFPLMFVAIGVLLALALAGHELWRTRLRWGT